MTFDTMEVVITYFTAGIIIRTDTLTLQHVVTLRLLACWNTYGYVFVAFVYLITRSAMRRCSFYSTSFAQHLNEILKHKQQLFLIRRGNLYFQTASQKISLAAALRI